MLIVKNGLEIQNKYLDSKNLILSIKNIENKLVVNNMKENGFCVEAEFKDKIMETGWDTLNM